MKIDGKRGATHIEFVISFIIFVIFILFIYTTLEPSLQIGRNKSFLMDYLKFQFEFGNFTTGDSSIMTITNSSIIPRPPGGGALQTCIKLTQISNTAFTVGNTNLVIKNESNSLLNYTFDGANSLLIGKMDSEDIYSGFFLKVYNSSLLESTYVTDSRDVGGPGCENIGSNAIAGSLVEEENQVFESKILDLINLYETNYAQLKQDLGFPEDSDFWIAFRYSNGTVIEPINQQPIPSTSSIYATEFPIEYLDSDANTQLGFFLVKVW